MILWLKRLFGRQCEHDWFLDGEIEHEGEFIQTWICSVCWDLLLVPEDTPEGG